MIASYKRLISGADLICKTDDHRGPALRKREQRQGPHVTLDDILLHRGERIQPHGIFQGD